MSRYELLNDIARQPTPITLRDVEFFIIDSPHSAGHAITKDGAYRDKPARESDPGVNTRSHHSPALHAIDPLYRTCFPIETEQQPISDSAENLRRNADKEFQAELPEGCLGSKEAWVYARDKTTGEIIGGINFIVHAGSNVLGDNGQRLVDGHSVIIYSFVEKEYRKRDLFSLLLNAHDRMSGAFIEKKLGLAKDSAKILSWCEQTDTGLISAKDHARDAMHSCERSHVFEKRGYFSIRSIDGSQVIYNQPDTAEPNGPNAARIVNRRVRGINYDPAIHPRALDKEGVLFFLASSSPKGTSLDHEEHANMKASLDRAEPVKLMPPGGFKALGEVLTAEVVEQIANSHYGDMPLALVAYEALKEPVVPTSQGIDGQAFRPILERMKAAFETFYDMNEQGIRAYVTEALDDSKYLGFECNQQKSMRQLSQLTR